MDLDALETSFDLVAPRGEELMEAFYARLFAAAPAVLPLFATTNMKRQQAMLLAALVLLRKSLRDLDAIVPSCARSARATPGTARSRSTTPSSARC
jgi:hemoglobin-like flavoprotein